MDNTVGLKATQRSLFRDTVFSKYSYGLRKFLLWRWDRSIRYVPVIKYLKKHYSKDSVKILEVGSGDYSMGLYDGYLVDGMDLLKPQRSCFLNKYIKGSITDPHCLPEKCYDVVVCVDVLEHIKPSGRKQAIVNMVSIAKEEVILVYPSGKLSRKIDKKIYDKYRKKVAPHHRWFDEHIKFGLPEDEFVKSVLDGIGDPIRYTFSKICEADKYLARSVFLLSKSYSLFMIKNKLLKILDLFEGSSETGKNFYRSFVTIKKK